MRGIVASRLLDPPAAFFGTIHRGFIPHSSLCALIEVGRGRRAIVVDLAPVYEAAAKEELRR
jgi:hypothetical protein